MDVIAVEPTEAINRDAHGAVSFQDSHLAQVHGGRVDELVAGYTFDPGGGLQPAVGDGSGLVFIRGRPGVIEFREGDIDHGNPHHRRFWSGLRSPDGDDLCGFHSAYGFFGGKGRELVRTAGEVARTGSLRYAHLGRRGGEIERRAGRFGRLEALDRPEQVVQPRGGDESQVGASFAQETRRVDEKSAASRVLEIGIEDGLARCHHRLGDAVPAVHLVDDVAVDILGLVSLQDFYGLFFSGRQCREKGIVLETIGQGGIGPFHDRPEVEPFIGPVGNFLLRAVEGVDDADLGAFASGGAEPSRSRHEPSRAGAGGAPG